MLRQSAVLELGRQNLWWRSIAGGTKCDMERQPVFWGRMVESGLWCILPFEQTTAAPGGEVFKDPVGERSRLS